MFINFRHTVLCCTAFSSLFLFGCDLSRNTTQMDRDANLEMQDFRDAFQPRSIEPEKSESLAFDASIPEFDTYITEMDGAAKPTPLVSVSVNQTVPLKDVLFELAKQADMDIELDPNISGSIIITARNKPFDVVIKRISEIAGLRYRFEDGILRIENDYPYQKTYQLKYINILRDTQTNFTTSLRLAGSGSDGADSQTDTGSDYTLTSSSTGDFWTEIEENITHILTEDVTAGLLKTQSDPTISVTASQPAPVRPTSGQSPDNQAAPTPRLNVSSLPTSSTTPNRGARVGGRAGLEEEAFEPTFSINQQSGIITVYAAERLQDKVDTFLNRVEKIITSQVLIEAKVLEVTLTDEYSTGIDWNAIIDNTGDTQLSTTFQNTNTLARPTFSPQAANNFSFTAAIEDVSVVVDALSRFGTVRGLASPRITVLNNQPAALNVSESRVYFEIEIETEESTNDQTGEQVDISTETFSVPEGVLINVFPSIDLDSNSTILSLKPSVTRVVSFVENPGSVVAVAIAQAQLGGDIDIGTLQTTVPELSVQEFDSIIKLKSGEVAVLGGLLEDRIESEREGVPVASEIPILGNLFRTQGDRITKSELVVLIKTTILENASDNISNTDRDFYKKFSGDRRPFKL